MERSSNPRAARIVRLTQLAALIGACYGSPQALAATITVTDSGDAGTASTCTLRQALASANANASGSSVCSAGSGADSIVFDPSITQVTLVPANGQLTLTDSSDTTIDGGVAGVVVDGANGTRLFNVTGHAAFAHLTIQNGNIIGNGGGIYNTGTLSLNNCAVSNNHANNHAGGIFNQGVLTITNSTVSGNTAFKAGGIWMPYYGNAGTLTMSNTTVSANQSTKQGGGIYAGAGTTATLTSSTITGNHATNGGGLASNGGNVTINGCTFSANVATNYSGGGAYNFGGTMLIANSTFTGNSVLLQQGGALYNSGGPMTIVNSTIVGNTGDYGIFSSVAGATKTFLANTIVANHAPSNCRGVFADNGGNLEDDLSCSFSQPGSINNTNPQLGSLADNGGPTLTMLPAPNSPVINAGLDSVCIAAPVSGVDQRGTARPTGAHCDIGAVESDVIFTNGFEP